MSREKQIEEMAKDLENHTCMSEYQAKIASKMLYIKGYRKASDFAEEIFAEIDELLSPYGSYIKTIINEVEGMDWREEVFVFLTRAEAEKAFERSENG